MCHFDDTGVEQTPNKSWGGGGGRGGFSSPELTVSAVLYYPLQSKSLWV